MSTMSKIALVKEMIDSAEASLRSAKQIIGEITGTSSSASIRSNYASAANDLGSNVTEEGKIVEGVFNGKSMVGSDGREYPVPANYASKSKLVPGDVMKLTVSANGDFNYKQIGPVDRKRVIGPLTQEEGQYKVIANGKAYKVLLASVTFYRAEPGDEVVLLVPEVGDSEWGAIDNVIPKLQAELKAEENFVKEARDAANSADLEKQTDEDDSMVISESEEISKESEDEEAKEKPKRGRKKKES